MKMVLPIVLTAAGLGAGVAAGMAVRPDPAEADVHAEASRDHGANDGHAEDGHAKADDGHGGESDDGHGGKSGLHDYVKMNNQFVVPVLKDARVTSLVVLSLDLEIAQGATESVFKVEPKLRDAFLSVLFDHANSGGFDGTFTSSGSMTVLRNALRETGQATLDGVISDVLITDIVRQDV